MRSNPRRAVTVFAVLLASALASPAWAADAPAGAVQEAADEFDRGVAAAKAGDPDGAAAHFERANHLVPSAGALRAAIRARRDAKEGARAATLAAEALETYPTDVDLVRFANETIAAVSPSLHQLRVRCRPACVLTIDRHVVRDAVTNGIVFVDPGEHTIAAGWDGKSLPKHVVAKLGGASDVTLAKPEEAPAPAAASSSESLATMNAAPTETTERKGLPKGIFFGGAALTAVLAGTTIWSALDTRAHPGADAVRAGCVDEGTSCPLYQDGLRRQHRTNILLGVTGGLAVVTGIVAIFTDWKGSKPAESARARLDVGFAPGGATIGASGAFAP